MSKGYVYVLTNPAMPGLVKIGKTTRNVEGRAHELYQTGVPVPFKVAHEVCTPDCHELEAVLHRQLDAVRVSQSREFFAIETREAVRVLDQCHHEQLHCWMDDYLPDHRIVPVDEVLEQEHVVFLAAELGIHGLEAISAIHEITPDELLPAFDRWRERTEKAAARRRADGILKMVEL